MLKSPHSLQTFETLYSQSLSPPSFKLDPKHPLTYIKVTVKNISAYQNLVNIISKGKKPTRAKSVIVSGGTPTHIYPRPSWKLTFYNSNPKTVFHPLIPKKPRLEIFPQEKYQGCYLTTPLGDFDPIKKNISLYPEVHLYDYLLIHPNASLSKKSLSLALTKTISQTLIEELAHSFQDQKKLHLSHLKYIRYSRSDSIILVKYFVNFLFLILLIISPLVIYQITPLTTLFLTFIILLAAILLLELIIRPKSPQKEAKIYKHDPFEVSAKKLAQDPQLQALALQAISVQVIASPSKLHSLQTYIKSLNTSP